MDVFWNGGGRELLVVGLLLLAWWKTGEALPGTSVNAHYVSTILVFASLLRLPALRLRSDTLLNLALGLDAYAVTVYYGEHRRQQQRSPRRNALLFAAAMPLERELQSRLGTDLLSAPLPAAHS